jgi:hypothetical protein
MLEHLWCWDKPRVTSESQDSPRPGLRGSHHLPPYSILYTSPRGLHPNGFLSRDSRRQVLKLPRLEFPRLCCAITSCSDLQSWWGMKQSCRSHRALSNGVLHTTCTHGGRVDSWHFVVGNQTASLIPDLSFCHNLCCKCPNGSCEPILDIYTLIIFQWYKRTLQYEVFWPPQLLSESSGFRRDSNSQNGSSLGSVSFHSHTLPHSSWPSPLQAFALVASPRLGLQQW